MKKLKLGLAVAFLLTLITASILHYFMGNTIPIQKTLYENGQIVSVAPFPPSSDFWFGTDQLGQDLFFRIIAGAKFTLLFAIIVSLGRIFIGLLIGLYLAYFKKGKSLFVAAAEPLNFIPTTIICLFILMPINVSTQFTSDEKVMIQLSIMILAAVPLLSLVVDEEIGYFMQKEFVQASKVLGGSYLHIVKTHLYPHLKGKILIIWLQQVVHSLILLAHLGLFQIFIGGTRYEQIYEGQSTPISDSSEWSGLIGSYFYQLQVFPWLLLFPVLFFTLCILSVNFIAESLITTPKKRIVIQKPIEEEKEMNKMNGIANFSLLNERTGRHNNGKENS